MRSCILVYLLFLSGTLFAQIAESGAINKQRSYFKGFFDREKVPQKSADFVELVKWGPDSLKHVEIRHITLDQIVLDAFLQKGEPVGIWYYHLANGGRILNYDFTLSYGSAAPDSSLQSLFVPSSLNISNYLENLPDKKYTAPVFATGDASLAAFIQNNLVFPYYAMVDQQYGQVLVGFQIDEEGTVSDITVEKGVNVFLDKEAMRLIKRLRFKSGPLLDGKPVRVYFRLYISFFQ